MNFVGCVWNYGKNFFFFLVKALLLCFCFDIIFYSLFEQVPFDTSTFFGSNIIILLGVLTVHKRVVTFVVMSTTKNRHKKN